MTLKQKQTVVVTGAAGFIGSHLCDALLSKGYKVVAIDNLSMGRIENIAHNLTSTRFLFIREDVRNLSGLRAACVRADCIVHLAAYKIPRYGNAIDTLIINTFGGVNVLELGKDIRCRLIMASTSDVYGKNQQLPFREDSDLVIGPSTVSRWSYAVSKAVDEHLAFAYSETYGFPVTILRLFGGYGPRQHLSWWGGPQSVFISAMLRGEPMEIHGDGHQTRTFGYISDLVDGVLRVIENNKANGEIINLGSTKEITILDLAKLIYRLGGREGDPPLKFVPYSSFAGGRYEDVYRRVPDISKARHLLGFEPQVSLEEGLRYTIEWQKIQQLTSHREEQAHMARRFTVPWAGTVKVDGADISVRTSPHSKGIVYFLLPAYNEERSISIVLQAIKQLMESLGLDYLVLVVNDGSRDGTAGEALRWAGAMPVCLISHTTNLGVGNAFRTGFQYLESYIRECDIIVSMDADSTQNITTTKFMLQKLQEGYELIVASGWAPGGMLIGIPFLRYILTVGCNFLYRLFFPIPGVHTYTSFYRAYSGRALLTAYARYGSVLFTSSGFAAMAEFLVRLRALPLFIAEVPMIVRFEVRKNRSKIRVVRTIVEHLRVISINMFRRRLL